MDLIQEKVPEEPEPKKIERERVSFDHETESSSVPDSGIYDAIRSYGIDFIFRFFLYLKIFDFFFQFFTVVPLIKFCLTMSRQ